jgi:multiple antibiotic resistance protein
MVSELLLTVVPLLVIVDPLASIGLYLSLTARHPADRPWVACKAALFASGVLVLCAFGGATLLKYLGIELYSLRVAGGLLLVFIGMNMLKEGADTTSQPVSEATESPRLPVSLPTGGVYQTQALAHDPSFVPLGLPMLAGPGALSLVIVHSTTYHWGVIVLAILLTMLVSLGVFLVVGKASSLLGANSQRVITRLMGLLTVAFAVQYVFSGLDEWLVSRASSPSAPC